MRKILHAQLDNALNDTVKANIQKVQDLFIQIRKASTRKKPATAELITFIKALEMDGLLASPKPEVKKWYQDNLALLVKTKEDRKAIENFLKTLSA